MKALNKFVIFVSLASGLMAGNYTAQDFPRITPSDFPRIADAIYKAEGGGKTKYPYGIKSIKYKGPASGKTQWARRICLNTIKNNYSRYNKLTPKQRLKYSTNNTHGFIVYLGSIYCPINDPQDTRGLNSNWVKNVNRFLGKEKN